MFTKIFILYAFAMSPQAAQADARVDCYMDASNRTSLTQELRVQLCLGATNLENVDCYLDASNRTSLTQELRVLLCKTLK
jgi:hypothetical protein